MIRAWLMHLFAAFVLALLSACSASDDGASDGEEGPTGTVEELYNGAKDDLEGGHFKKAVEKFEAVEQQYPYSEWAVRAQVMAAYASYRNEEYDDAVAMLERFVKLHPGSDSTPYAFYLTALCYYEQISDIGRDQKMTQQALQALQEVIQRYPDSKYARDARLKLDLVADHLAGKEMQVGRYYLTRNEYLSAINRFRYVLDHYQTTSHTPEALHRLVECYLKLGVREEAKKYAAVLGYNFSGSPWYRDSYALLDGKGLEAKPEGEGFWNSLIP